MRVVREGVGLDYRLRFLHDGIWMHECVVSPHNMDKVITQVWHDFADDEIMWEDVANSRVKAIRIPGKKY